MKKIKTIFLTLIMIISMTSIAIAGHQQTVIRIQADAGGPYSGYTNEPIQFTGSAQYGWKPYTHWHWAFSDGTTATGQTVHKAFPTSGSYTATLTVTDFKGYTDSDIAYISVSNPPYDLSVDVHTDGHDHTYREGDYVPILSEIENSPNAPGATPGFYWTCYIKDSSGTTVETLQYPTYSPGLLPGYSIDGSWLWEADEYGFYTIYLDVDLDDGNEEHDTWTIYVSPLKSE